MRTVADQAAQQNIRSSANVASGDELKIIRIRPVKAALPNG